MKRFTSLTASFVYQIGKYEWKYNENCVKEKRSFVNFRLEQAEYSIENQYYTKYNEIGTFFKSSSIESKSENDDSNCGPNNETNWSIPWRVTEIDEENVQSVNNVNHGNQNDWPAKWKVQQIVWSHNEQVV